MIELLVIRDKNENIVFSCANMPDEEKVEFVLSADRVENEDLEKIENVCDDVNIDSYGSIVVRMSLGTLKKFKFSKLSVSIETYKFNSKDTLKKVK